MSEPAIQGTDEATQLVSRVRALRPLIEEHAAETERLRRLADPVVEAICGSGVFELMVPRKYGGLELHLDTFLEVGLALGEADASAAWVTTFLIEHNWMFCQFPEALQDELYRDRSHVLAPGMVAPTGQATREKDGHRLSGRWQWATGVMHSDWVIAGALVAGEEVPDLRFFALPIGEVKVEDTWHVDGMCGTGSHDVVIDDVFVPDEHSVSVGDMSNGAAPGAKLHSGPLYRTPMAPILSQAASMPLLGTAKACVRRFRERSQERFMMYSQTLQSEDLPAQTLVARSALEVDQAELLLRRVVAEVMELRDEASLEKRAEWAASYALVVQQSLRIVQELSSASGASAHRLDNPLQRALRDLGTAACHVVFDLNAQLKNYGRLKLGLEASSRLF